MKTWIVFGVYEDNMQPYVGEHYGTAPHEAATDARLLAEDEGTSMLVIAVEQADPNRTIHVDDDLND